MRAAVELMTNNVEIEDFDLAGIPRFIQDYGNQPPQTLKDFKAKIKAADALLKATPENNYSILGMLKNAIDVASRPYADKVFDGKIRRRHDCIHRSAWRFMSTVPHTTVICVS